MATIELYKDKINNMSNYIEQAKNAVNDFCVDLSALKSKILGINSSVCDNVVSSISSSSQTQEQQIAGLEATQKEVNAFIDLTINRDNAAATAVSKAKDEFYKEYSYLKPDTEKSGWEKFCDGLKKIDEFCKDLWNEISNSKFFDFIGRIIHTQNFRDLVECFVGIFYQVGGVNLIKSLSAIGTYCAVFQRKHPLLATLFDGNYINESGEYSYLYAEVNREYSVNMSLELLYDNNGDGVFSANERLYDYAPTEKQWWITGFDPLKQNVKADDLKAITTIDFSSFGEKKDIMLEAFREFNAGESEWDIPEKDSNSYIVTLTW